MSIFRLQGVDLVQVPITKCRTCTGNLIARKLEVVYTSLRRNGQSSFMLSDVWYCKSCDRGYALSSFQKIVDRSNHNWLIQENKQVERKIEPPKMQQKPSVKVIRLDFIDSILHDHADTCSNCSVILVKCNIELKIAKGNSANYIP